MSAGSHLCYATAVLFFFFLAECATLTAVSRATPSTVFYTLPAYQRAGKDTPTPFLYSYCLQRTLVVRTLCTGNCAKTKSHIERKEGCWVRVMTQGVYTALFSFSLSTVVLFFFFSFSSPDGVWNCVYMSWLLGTSLFGFFYVISISSFLETKTLWKVYLIEVQKSRTGACFSFQSLDQ